MSFSNHIIDDVM